MNNELNKQTQTWQIKIMKQRKNVCCYYCDTTILKRLNYYENPIQHNPEKLSYILTEGAKLIIEFTDRSDIEFEKGWLLKMGYELIGSDGIMDKFEKTDNENKIKEKYNIEPPKIIPKVPNFYIKCNIYTSKVEILYKDFYTNFWDNCLPKYKENYNEFLKYVENTKIAHKELIINKDDIPLKSEKSSRGIRNTYTYTCPENSIVIMNNKNINEGIDGIYIQ